MKSDKPEPGCVYFHYKEGIYEVIMVAPHTETKEMMVAYWSLIHDTPHIRPLSVWMSEVNDKPKVKRFALM